MTTDYPLGPPSNRKPAQETNRKGAQHGAKPARKDVVQGKDGKWETKGYEPVPVYTKNEPKWGAYIWPFPHGQYRGTCRPCTRKIRAEEVRRRLDAGVCRS